LKSKSGFYACGKNSTDIEFSIIQEKDGFSFLSNLFFLGISKEGKVKVFADNNTWDTRLIPVFKFQPNSE
jgi:hypothetical protein